MVALPGTGETVSGFTVTELDSYTCWVPGPWSFTTPAKWRPALFIQNDDPNWGLTRFIGRPRGFDETDVQLHTGTPPYPTAAQSIPAPDIFF